MQLAYSCQVEPSSHGNSSLLAELYVLCLDSWGLEQPNQGTRGPTRILRVCHVSCMAQPQGGIALIMVPIVQQRMD